MSNFNEVQVILLKIIISNLIIVNSNNTFDSFGADDLAPITIDDLNKIIRDYPAFIKLKLQEQNYYTGSGASLCPLPYDSETVEEDTIVMDFLRFQNIKFDPRNCKKPWTWTQHNERLVPIEISISGKKLGNIISLCKKDNIDVEQCYTLYLNVMESSSLTIVDRLCLFLITGIDNFNQIQNDKNMVKASRELNVTLSQLQIYVIVGSFKRLLVHFFTAFKRYFISTLPLDCIENVLEKFYPSTDKFEDSIGDVKEYREHLLDCMKITKLKKNFAFLGEHENWNWDIDSEEKPEFNSLVKMIYNEIKTANKLFLLNE